MPEYSKYKKPQLPVGKYFSDKWVLIRLPSDYAHVCCVPVRGFFFLPTEYGVDICHHHTTINAVRWPNVSDWQQYTAMVMDNLHCRSFTPGERYRRYYVKYMSWVGTDKLTARAMGMSRTSLLDLKSGRRK